MAPQSRNSDARPVRPRDGATLSARNVSKSFGPHQVLHDVSLLLAEGRKVGIVAANGTGKSTLLRLLSGSDVADSGKIERAPLTATVGYLEQEPDRRDDETVEEFLRRRTGIAAATVEFETSTIELGKGVDGAEDRYSDALERFLALGAAEFDARAGEVCAEVGLDVELLRVPMNALSGGQAARASLASVLLSRFDVFLLDEPTNDLDFAGLEMLETFVRQLPVAVAIVSHDRAFLERTINAVLEIDDHTHTAKEYGGGWLAYLEERATSRRHEEEAYATYTDQRSSLLGRAQRERQWATQGVNKVKKSGETDKFIKAFKTASSEQLAGKAKRTEQMIDRLEAVEKPWEGWDLRFEILAAPRAGAVTARLDAAIVRLGEFSLGPISLEISTGERVAILGENGSGKTTLLGAVLGTLPLDGGGRYLGPGVVLGTLAQSRSRFGAATLLDGFIAETGFVINEARALLAKFSLTSEHVLRSAATLSPGERTRAELALLMARGVTCIVLDEPTNHLDLIAIEQLEQAMESFAGTVIVVSHDRRLLESLSLTRRIELRDGKIIADAPAD